MSENINDNDQDKGNNGKINFKWKEIDDDANKKSRRRFFSFIKGRAAGNRKLLTKGRVILGVLCLFVLAVIGSFVYAYNSVPSIDPDASSIYTNIDLSSIIYDAKGEEIDKLYYTEDREIVSIKDIPENTKNAFIGFSARSSAS